MKEGEGVGERTPYGRGERKSWSSGAGDRINTVAVTVALWDYIRIFQA